MDLTSFALTAFATLFVTIGPIETSAVYAALTADVHKPERGQLAWRSVSIAGLLLVAFALFGNPTLDIMHVSLPAFRVAGGVMLFLQAISLVFSQPHGLSSISAAERHEALGPGDIAVFPLAFPLIAGPGSLAAVVLLMGRTPLDGPHSLIIFGALAACLALTYLALRGAEGISRLLGLTGSDVVGRVSGILLAALAVQFIFDGVREGRLFN